MKIDVLNGEAFKKACTAFLDAAFWAQTLPEDERETTGGEHLDDAYSHEDCAPQTLEYIEGECLEIWLKMRNDGITEVTEEDLYDLFFGLGGSATGSGISATDDEYQELDKDYVKSLEEWYDKRRGVRTLNMYPGDDGKVYVEGFEHRKPMSVSTSLAISKGRFGARYVFAGCAVTDAALIAAEMKKLAQVEHWEKRWLLCYNC